MTDQTANTSSDCDEPAVKRARISLEDLAIVDPYLIDITAIMKGIDSFKFIIPISN